MTKLDRKELINYVITNDATLKQASEHFDVSIWTVKKAMSAIKENLTDPELLSKLNNVAHKNEQLGKQKGGKSHNSGKKRKYSMEEISLYAMKFIAENMTIETASQCFKIPKSTLFENFELLNCDEYQELYNDLAYVYDCHNHGTNSDVIIDVEKINLNRDETWLKPLQHNDIIRLESLMVKYSLKLEELSKFKSR